MINWEGEDAIQVVLEEVTDKVELERTALSCDAHDDPTDVFNRRAIYDWLNKQLITTWKCLVYCLILMTSS
ncbi:hypothetical protein O9929_16850 [Vibrio lentus]|nr:hypothetical protein [Vibrio lentus]